MIILRGQAVVGYEVYERDLAIKQISLMKPLPLAQDVERLRKKLKCRITAYI